MNPKCLMNMRETLANILASFLVSLSLSYIYIYIYIYLTKTSRYFITLEITLIHTVDIEDNKYYLNNIMEKVIPKSKTKFLQNFYIYIYSRIRKTGTTPTVQCN